MGKPQNCGCKTSGSSWKERGIPNCSCKHKVGYTTTGRGTLRTNTSDSSCWRTCSRFLHSEVRDNERRCHHVTTKFIVGDTKTVSCVHVSSISTKDQKRRSVFLIRSTHGRRHPFRMIGRGWHSCPLRQEGGKTTCPIENHWRCLWSASISPIHGVGKRRAGSSAACLCLTCKFVQSSTVFRPDKELGPFGSGCESFSLL